MDVDQSTSRKLSDSPKKRKNVTITYDKSSEIKKLKQDEEGFKVPAALVTDESSKPNLAYKMMFDMGWTEGKGLGKKNQGITEPVAPSTQLNKRGLGLTKESLRIDHPDTEWSAGADPASATGDILISLAGQRLFSDYNDFLGGMVVGTKLMSIEDEIRFCEPQLLREMLKCKTLLDEHGVFMDGRSRSNPYEKIGSGIFLNRAAMKMANMDSVMNGLFTTTEKDQTLFFADICAGPGGFTEYMLWRKPLKSCGFGFTLKVPMNDFRLKDILCGPVECFHPSYGKNDDGDIFNEENLRKFQQEVMSSTGGVGVHTVLADGGFSVEGQENMQEILSKQLYLCQMLCAVNILRPEGNFVCKLFDTFTEFTVGLIYLVSTLFDNVAIIKPITSRPANSERYIIFQNMTDERLRLESIRDYLYNVNKKLIELKDTENDVIKLVSHKTLKKDHDFFEFIKTMNDRILDQQIIALAKLHAFIMDRNLVDDRQTDIRNEALQLWNVPDIHRDHFKGAKPPLSVNKFVNISERHFIGGLKTAAKKAIIKLTDNEFMENKFIVRNYYAGFMSHTVTELNKSPYVLMKDKRTVRWYPDSLDACPEKMNDTITKKWSWSMPSFTILLVHFGTEYYGSKGNIKVNGITVVDGALIYGEDISHLPYTDRMDKISNLCTLLDPKQKGHIKTIDYFPLPTLCNYLTERMSMKHCKGVPMQPMINIVSDKHFFAPWKLLLINIVKAPWLMALSRHSGAIYYYNAVTRASVTDKPDDLFASYSESNIYEVDWTGLSDSLHRDQFLNLLRKKS